MFDQNHTQAFINAMFNDADYSHIITEAHCLDKSGLEAKRQKKQAEFDKRFVKMKRKKVEEKRVPGMTRVRLDDQLKKLQCFWGDRIKILLKSHVLNLDDKWIALENIFKEHLNLLEALNEKDVQFQGSEDTSREVVNDWYEEEDAEFEEES
ncbi:hypothetical protein EV421DRAFT_1910522 [Armillaria borealis]|uniref:Uncharacterized protein n=1 Tax=Armillaria borealis TaxID=47425 RepID=A0AA39IYV1_9AGAR|nr:hypothetical protein EV421DRAFT_1910522 [Armillaria borealis]